MYQHDESDEEVREGGYSYETMRKCVQVDTVARTLRECVKVDTVTRTMRKCI